MTMTPEGLREALRKLAEAEPEKYEMVGPDWVYYIKNGSKMHGWSIEAMNSDAFDEIAAELGMVIEVNADMNEDTGWAWRSAVYLESNGSLRSNYRDQTTYKSKRLATQAGLIKAIEIHLTASQGDS